MGVRPPPHLKEGTGLTKKKLPLYTQERSETVSSIVELVCPFVFWMALEMGLPRRQGVAGDQSATRIPWHRELCGNLAWFADQFGTAVGAWEPGCE